MKNRILAIGITLVMLFGLFSPVFAASGNPKVDYLVDNGYVKGDAQGGLNLYSTVTRAEMATLIARVKGLEEDASFALNTPTGFSDVPVGHWAAGYLNVIKHQNIITGYPDGTFKPDATVTYDEAITMMARTGKQFTQAELAQAKYPTTYIATATKLGQLVGVPLKNLKAPMLRETVFEIVYNTLTSPIIDSEGIGNVEKVNVLVTENSRVANLNKDSVTMETLDGDTKYTVKVKNDIDTEEIFGKVIEAHLKDYELVDYEMIDVDYVGGEVEADLREVEIDKKYYEVNNPKVYVNGESIQYSGRRGKDFLDIIDEEEMVLSFLTIKDKEVLFIDAYTIENVFTLTDARKGEFYDSKRYGDKNKLDLSKYLLLEATEGSVRTEIDSDDLEDGDIIHLVDRKTALVYTNKEGKVEGRLDSVSKDGKDIFISIDKEEYAIEVDSKVYNTLYSAGDRYYPVTANYRNELSGLLRENVIAYQNLLGKIQLIDSEEDVAFGYGIITDELRGEFKIYTEAGNDWYSTTTRTRVVGVSGSKNEQLDAIRIGDLVKFNSLDNILTEIEILTDIPQEVSNVDTRVIRFKDNTYAYTDKRTIVFNNITTPTHLTVEDFYKVFDKEEDIEGYVYTNPKDKSNVAEVIVITDAVVQKDVSTDSLIAVLDRVYYGRDETIARLKLENDKTEEYAVKDSIVNDIELNSIIEVNISKGRNPEITKAKVLISGDNEDYFEIDVVRRDNIVLKDLAKDKKTVRLAYDSGTFGYLREGDIVEISRIDELNTIKAIRVLPREKKPTGYFDPIDMTRGLVTYIEKRVGYEGLEIEFANGKIDFVELKGRLRMLVDELDRFDLVELVYEEGKLVDIIKIEDEDEVDIPEHIQAIIDGIENLDSEHPNFEGMVRMLRRDIERLSEDEKALISNYDKLVEAEEEIEGD